MAIDHKGKKPVVDGLKLRFVRFSGHALTQGVVNTKIDGVPVRVYSAAKTVADPSSTEGKWAATSQQEFCEKAQLAENVANRGSGISRKYAGSTK
jgi:hypothetical protein